MVKRNLKLPRVQGGHDSYIAPGEFIEVPLEHKNVTHKESPAECKAAAKGPKSPVEYDGKCQTKQEVCAAPMNMLAAPVIPNMQEEEYQHQKDLETLEIAIAKKRADMRKQLEEDHMREKAALEQKLQEMEHARLTQLQDFRTEVRERTQNVEQLRQQFDNSLTDHCKKLEEFRALERGKTFAIVEQIATIRLERDRLAPQIGILDGKLQLMYDAEEEADISIPKGMLADLEQKLQDTLRQNANEEQELEHFAGEQVDLLMDEINNLDQELEDEKRRAEETRQMHDRRLGEIQAIIQKTKRVGPMILDEEKQKIQDEVTALKEYWKDLRGHIEEQVEDILDHTEKKKFDGRDKLLKQRAAFFQERQKRSVLLRDAAAKLYEKQREVETARQLFYDRLNVKNAELDEMEDIHQERLQGRCERRDKRLKELEAIEAEKAKRLQLEISLLETKKEKMLEGFDIKKSHIKDAINDTEKRVVEVTEELNRPREKDNDKINKMLCKLATVKQDRDYIVEQSDFAKLLAKQEIDVIKSEGESMANNYNNKIAAKEKELFTLKQTDDKLHDYAKRQNDLNNEKFIKETETLTKQTEKLQQYFDNLTEELYRLKAERQLLRDEYILAQEGIRNAILADEDDIEKERERIHGELDKERNQFNQTIGQLNARVAEARRRRHEMTAKFKRDINVFTAKAMGMGRGTIPGAGAGAGGTPTATNMLDSYRELIQKYTFRVHALNDKLELVRRELKAKTDESNQAKLDETKNLEDKQNELQIKLKNKLQLVKEGNKLLQLFANDDNCLYCKEKNPSKNQRDQLQQLHEDNRKLTEKLTNLFKKEKEYDRVSSRQLDELRTTLETSSKFSVSEDGTDRHYQGQHPGSRTISESSKGSSSMTFPIDHN